MPPMSGHGTNGGANGLGPVEAEALVSEGALLLDVREDYEWEAGHAPAARHIPLGRVPAEVGDLPKDRHLVVICRAGHRSAQATAFLVRSGFDATNIEGGMQAWALAGLPVVDSNGASGVIA
jgi:rhodanese-related sulfurtransferase